MKHCPYGSQGCDTDKGSSYWCAGCLRHEYALVTKRLSEVSKRTPSLGKLSLDTLQNELILIDHHLGDIEKAVQEGDPGYAQKGLKDAKEAIQRLSAYLPKKASSELKRMEESLTSRQRRINN